MGEIDDIHHPEDDGQPQGNQRQNHSDEDASNQRAYQDIHGHNHKGFNHKRFNHKKPILPHPYPERGRDGRRVFRAKAV